MRRSDFFLERYRKNQVHTHTFRSVCMTSDRMHPSSTSIVSTSIVSTSFDASEGLPTRPPGTRLREVQFRTCPGSDLTLRVVRDERGSADSSSVVVDAHGVCPDGWWVVSCHDLPDRAMRLYRGSHSLRELLRRYGFQDASGCLNHRQAIARYTDERASLPSYDLRSRVPRHLHDAVGVPQFYARSGVCWYATLCLTSFANPDMAKLLFDHMPADLRALGSRCLHSREDAEAFRKKLWYEYAIGDNVDLPPERDGRNGFSEFTVLCAKMRVPMVRLREEGGLLHPMPPTVHDRNNKSHAVKKPKSLDEPHLLVLRFQDGDHQGKFPLRRKLLAMGGREYVLMGVYMGQRKCGHQIGMACPTGHWRDWVLGDADLHKDGIGPIFVHFEGPKWCDKWWDAWKQLVHVTKYGMGMGELCQISPHNFHPREIDKYRRAASSAPSPPTRGENSLDVVYRRNV